MTNYKDLEIKIYNVVETDDTTEGTQICVNSFTTLEKATIYINEIIAGLKDEFKDHLNDVDTDNQTYFNVDSESYYVGISLQLTDLQ